MVVNYAQRRKFAVIEYNDFDQSFCPRFAWFGLRQKLTTKADEAQIEFMKRGEAVQDLFAAGRLLGLNPVVGPVEFWVRSENEAQARELLAGVDESHVLEEEMPDQNDEEIDEEPA